MAYRTIRVRVEVYRELLRQREALVAAGVAALPRKLRDVVLDTGKGGVTFSGMIAAGLVALQAQTKARKAR